MIDPSLNRKPKRLKSTRLFSLQLADHDFLFAPRRKKHYQFKWMRLLVYGPACLLLVIPSFKLGRAMLKNPGAAYNIPDTLNTGDIFTVPVDDEEEIVPQIGGHELPEIDAKKPLHLAVAGKSDFDVSFAFVDSDRPKLKTLIEKLKHPEYAMFVKRVHVKAPEPPLPDSLLALEEKVPGKKRERVEASTKTAAPAAPPPMNAKEAKLYQRIDGKIRLRCWKEPVVEPLGVDPLKPRRLAKLGVVNAAGPGEVFYAGTVAPQEALVVIYHGGGLYTRYWGLKDTRVQKGVRVTAGQTVGYMILPPKETTVQANWTPYLSSPSGPTEIKASGLLALSSQLCETK